MKLRPVSKIDKRNKKRQKCLTIMSCQKNVTRFPFFQFAVNLEQSGSQIANA